MNDLTNGKQNTQKEKRDKFEDKRRVCMCVCSTYIKLCLLCVRGVRVVTHIVRDINEMGGI